LAIRIQLGVSAIRFGDSIWRFNLAIQFGGNSIGRFATSICLIDLPDRFAKSISLIDLPDPFAKSISLIDFPDPLA
jgi:hypothetical protein